VAHTPSTAEHAVTDEQGIQHRFRYLNGAPLNEANFDLKVNFLGYWQTTPDGKVTHFSWVRDIPINESNLMPLMRGGRARWKIRTRNLQHSQKPRQSLEEHRKARERKRRAECDDPRVAVRSGISSECGA